MNQENRVLSRRGARELEPGELDAVNGGFKVFTICSGFPTHPDGDCR